MGISTINREDMLTDVEVGFPGPKEGTQVMSVLFGSAVIIL